ncbi:MAG: CBS domain-containing protein, partial [Spirochaetaceae bacterium]|nr:CBS domain-containing protein [Spirochaetaceae bacterium]
RSPLAPSLKPGIAGQELATRRCDLVTCRKDELISEVMERMSSTERYDYLPVTDGDSDGAERIVGLYSTNEAAAGGAGAEPIYEYSCPLSEEFLIGAKTTILDYMIEGHAKPVRFVVSDYGIVGIVTLSDLQKPPARVALFALITGFEITMSEVINSRFPCDGWMKCLSRRRRQKLKEEMEKSRSAEHDRFVQSLLFTQFADKRDILVGSNAFEPRFSKSRAQKELKKIQQIRDQLAHANEYSTRDLCGVVRTLLDLRRCL